MPASCKEELNLFLNSKCRDSEVVIDLKAVEWLKKCWRVCWNHTCNFSTPRLAEKYSKVLIKEHSFIFLCSRLYMLPDFILFLLWAGLMWVRIKFMPDGKVTLILFCCLCNAASVRYGDKLLVTYYTIAIILISIFFSLIFITSAWWHNTHFLSTYLKKELVLAIDRNTGTYWMCTWKFSSGSDNNWSCWIQ